MIRNLAYLGIETPDVDAWRMFGPDILGAPTVPGDDDTVRLRVDDAAWRIAVHRGPANDLAYLGWDVGDAAGLADIVDRLAQAGVVVEVDSALAAQRGAAALVAFVDPFGFRHELVHGLATGDAFVPPAHAGGFVTGEQGLGHVVLIVPDLERAERFYLDTLGFRLSDTITSGVTLRFFHCAGQAARHHTVALVAVPGLVGLHHLMLEVPSLDDVGLALDRVQAAGMPLASSLGRHPNDLMTSFYVRCPAGFEIEYGTGGRLIDDASWDDSAHYDATSTWGHLPPASGSLAPGIIRPFAETH